MSEEDIQIVRDQFAAVNARDFERAMELYADDVVLTVDASYGLDEGTYEGRETVGEWFGDWFRQFERGFHFDIDEARQIGNAVFLHARLSGVGRSSGVPVESDLGYLYGVRDGKVVRVEIFGTREEALAAAEPRQ